MPAEPSTDRRTALADAAITVVAEQGLRGLTHRAVDRAAALPPGTTSAYLRTRAALLTALVRRLVALDQAELESLGAAAPPPRTADELADGIAAFAALRLTGDGRRRTLARYACTVESVRHRELREILVPHDNAAQSAVRALLAGHGVPEPAERTRTLLACVDGLVFDRLIGGGEVGRDEIRALIGAAIRGPEGGAGAGANGR